MSTPEIDLTPTWSDLVPKVNQIVLDQITPANGQQITLSVINIVPKMETLIKQKNEKIKELESQLKALNRKVLVQDTFIYTGRVIEK